MRLGLLYSPQQLGGCGDGEIPDALKTWISLLTNPMILSEGDNAMVLSKVVKKKSHLENVVQPDKGFGYEVMTETNHENIHSHSTSSHSHMDNSVFVFFTPKDLKEGKVLSVYFRRDSSMPPHLLPRDEAHLLPFSTSELPFLLQIFGFSRGSPQAKAMEDTLRQCGDRVGLGGAQNNDRNSGDDSDSRTKSSEERDQLNRFIKKTKRTSQEAMVEAEATEDVDTDVMDLGSPRVPETQSAREDARDIPVGHEEEPTEHRAYQRREDIPQENLSMQQTPHPLRNQERTRAPLRAMSIDSLNRLTGPITPTASTRSITLTPMNKSGVERGMINTPCFPGHRHVPPTLSRGGGAMLGRDSRTTFNASNDCVSEQAISVQSSSRRGGDVHDLKLMVWNVRGAGNQHFLNELKEHLLVYKPQVLALLKTHISENRSTKYVNEVDLTDGIEWKHRAFKGAFGYYEILVKLQLRL
ncbi:hypothetical protein Cgig2_002808 [Carnegiea gigantea]|uniref:BURP domain-containing protein n=1 Tax=Carnegiea gigantea TaxID=171969 RepID=A0A9Q1KPU2_9CARY|nr:hypothetical protein Cgig2_002808 [Carnegiea gigantea]